VAGNAESRACSAVKMVSRVVGIALINRFNAVGTAEIVRVA